MRFAGATLTLFMVLSASALASPLYTISILQTPKDSHGSSAQTSGVLGVNDLGMATGWGAWVGGVPKSAVVWDGAGNATVITAIDTSGTGPSISGASINNNGLILGGDDRGKSALIWQKQVTQWVIVRSTTSDYGYFGSQQTRLNNQGYALLATGGGGSAQWAPNGTITNLPSSGNSVGDLNDVGQIATNQSLIQPDGTTLTVPTPSGFNSIAVNNISNPGLIAGVATNATESDVFTFNPTTNTITVLPNLAGFTNPATRGIDDTGIIGGFETLSGAQQATIWADGSAYSALSLITNASGWTSLKTITDVSANGHMVGLGVFQGTFTNFVLTPAPEPDSLLIFPLVWLFARRRRI